MALEIKNITTVEVRPKSSIIELLNKDIKIGPQFNNKKKQALYNDLFLLLNAGLDIKKVLELVIEEQSNKKDKKELIKISDSVLKGNSFSEALATHPDFSEYEVFSIKIGEESGELIKVLSHLKEHFSKKIEQKRLLTSALSYPIIVALIAIGAVAFMIGFVVPKFADTYNSFNAKLPPLTQWLLDVSKNFNTIATVSFGSVLLLIVLLKVNKQKTWMKKLKASVLLRTPFIGPIIKLSKLTQFCQSMELLSGAKTPLIDSIDLTSKMLDFHPIQVALIDARNNLMNGQTLSHSLKAHPFFPKRMNYLIGVGEEVNKLEEIFNQLGTLYGKELEHKSKVLGNVLEPVLLVFIAVLVGFIVVALYMPMFSLSELL